MYRGLRELIGGWRKNIYRRGSGRDALWSARASALSTDSDWPSAHRTLAGADPAGLTRWECVWRRGAVGRGVRGIRIAVLGAHGVIA